MIDYRQMIPIVHQLPLSPYNSLNENAIVPNTLEIWVSHMPDSSHPRLSKCLLAMCTISYHYGIEGK